MIVNVKHITAAIRVPVVLALIVVVLTLYVWSAVWLYRDATVRNRSGCLIVLVLFICVPWPFSLLVWLVCRPHLAEIYPSLADLNK
jgi:hypothetical protein